MELTLNQLFLTDDPESYEPPEIMTHVSIYNIKEFKEFGYRTVENYFSLIQPDN